jgi:pimeloyl-ACP methyl ester carboxylesterase
MRGAIACEMVEAQSEHLASIDWQRGKWADAKGRYSQTYLAAPTRLLIGEKERLYEPHATLKLAQRRMPGLTGAIVPDADHIGAMARPDEINERIIRSFNGRDSDEMSARPWETFNE